MLAETIPASEQLATKTDLDALGARLEQKITQVQADLMRWMLTFFVPLWIGVYGTMAAVVIALILER